MAAGRPPSAGPGRALGCKKQFGLRRALVDPPFPPQPRMRSWGALAVRPMLATHPQYRGFRLLAGSSVQATDTVGLAGAAKCSRVWPGVPGQQVGSRDSMVSEGHPGGHRKSADLVPSEP